jgi:hypothetical protein
MPLPLPPSSFSINFSVSIPIFEAVEGEFNKY